MCLFDDDIEKNKFVEEKIKENFDLGPRGIREMLKLNKPIYAKTAAYGHFGRTPESDGAFSWENTDKTQVFKIVSIEFKKNFYILSAHY